MSTVPGTCCKGTSKLLYHRECITRLELCCDFIYTHVLVSPARAKYKKILIKNIFYINIIIVHIIWFLNVPVILCRVTHLFLSRCLNICSWTAMACFHFCGGEHVRVLVPYFIYSDFCSYLNFWRQDALVIKKFFFLNRLNYTDKIS